MKTQIITYEEKHQPIKYLPSNDFYPATVIKYVKFMKIQKKKAGESIIPLRKG